MDTTLDQPQIQTIGLLYETETDLLSSPSAQLETHYHWREVEEIDAVAAALTQLGYHVERMGAIANLLGGWHSHQRPDFVFNLSVRTLSRNRTAIAPALLEALGIPYSGADAAVKSLTLNKDWLKLVLKGVNIQTPPWHRYGSRAEVSALPAWPVSILKPSCEGYSLGLTRFETSQGLDPFKQLVAELLETFQTPILCEPLIQGREITVGVVGNTTPLLFGAVETVDREQQPMGDRILDLNQKRFGEFKKVRCSLDDSLLHPLQSVVLQLMGLLHPLNYATFDFRITLDGQIYLLDINADATLHPQRSFAQIADQAGITYCQLIEMILSASGVCQPSR